MSPLPDSRVLQAAEHHRIAGEAKAHRQQRDGLVRAVWADELQHRADGLDPEWTYAALAKAVGCSPELIARIIKER